MIELEKLSAEKQQKLLDVIECCKVSEKKFEREFELLDIDDKKTIILYMLDNEYYFIDNDNDDYKKNKDIIDFLKKDKYKLIIKDIHDEVVLNKEDVEFNIIKKNVESLEKFYKKYPTYDEKSFSDEDIINFKEIIKDIDNDDLSKFDTLTENEKIKVVLFLRELRDLKQVGFYKKETLVPYILDTFLLPITHIEETYNQYYYKNK
jgi:lipopolysaccharide export LptBFGC system permease protein LptF